MSARTLYEKLIDSHRIAAEADGTLLLYVDKHLLHEVSTPQSFEMLRDTGRKPRRPNSSLALTDHSVPTADRDLPIADPQARAQVERLARNVTDFDIPFIPLASAAQGIAHVVGPEQGYTLPGALLVCGDSHTSTHGAFGTLAFGIGASECGVALATQAIRQRREATMRVSIDGRCSKFVEAKDIALAIIAEVGAGGGTGYAIEYTGEVVRGFSMAARMTLCNMAIESGARIGLIAPDDETYRYLEGRPMAPRGTMWAQALDYWRTLPSDDAAMFDRYHRIDASSLSPYVTWGTSPQDAAPVSARIPEAVDERTRRALAYMGLEAGASLADLAIDVVFIGSCTNGRIEDLRNAAAIAAGRRVSPHVRALVVPGSTQVKLQAEAEGLDRIFTQSGFEWREAGCSLCVAMNNDRLNEGQRCASTSNRNFEGRQGRGSRTHLMNPAMAAAAAIAGHIVDVREFAGAE